MLADIKEHEVNAGDVYPVVSYLSNNAVTIMSPKDKVLMTVEEGQYKEHGMSKDYIDGRMDVIGQNGNDALHYDVVNNPILTEFKPEWNDSIDDFKGRPDYYDLSGYNRLEDLIAPMPHFRGSAFKYLLRSGKKDKAKELEDLQKARECLDIEIERLNKGEK